MPPAKTPTKVARSAAAKAPPQPRGRFSRAFGRFSAAQKQGGKGRTASLLTLLRDVKQELKKVEWPTREQAVKLTGAVVGLSAVVGMLLGAIDFIFQETFKALIGLSGGGV